MSTPRSFAAVVADKLDRHGWENLLSGQVGLLRIPEFVQPQRCRAALEQLDSAGHFVAYNPMDECGGIDPEAHRQISLDLLAGRLPEDGPPVCRRLGRTLYEHTARGTEQDYFAEAPLFDVARRETFSDGGDVVEEILQQISAVTGRAARIAEDREHGPCFAGVIRDVHGRSRLHTDDSREETPGFSFSETPLQLGFNIFLDMPAQGGELTIYSREFQPEDADYRHGYGLDPRAVAGEPSVRIAPRAGDLILFPARNIHSVDACPGGPGRRIMMQAHLGVHGNGDVDCWS